MLEQILLALAANPRLLGEHVAAYAGLARLELPEALRALRLRLLLQRLALSCASTSAVLTGVALIARELLPAQQSSWMLVVVPLVPALLALACWAAARPVRPSLALDGLLRQLQADGQLLREWGAR